MKLPWLKESYQQVIQLVSRGSLPHALLFHGGAGLGKQSLTKDLAAFILCDEKTQSQALLQACGHCRSCTLMAADTHPDIFSIDQQDEHISVDTIRSIITWVQGHAARGGSKLVLLPEIERMTPAAANALLKVLEEPPGKTCFLLTSNHLKALLPTIVSRCQLWRIEANKNNLGRNYLLERGFAAQQVNSALARCSGSPLQALLILESGESNYFDELITLFSQWVNAGVITEILVAKISKQPVLFELLLTDLVKSKMSVSTMSISKLSVSKLSVKSTDNNNQAGQQYHQDPLQEISNKLSLESLHHAHRALLELNQALKISSGLNITLHLTSILVTLKAP